MGKELLDALIEDNIAMLEQHICGNKIEDLKLELAVDKSKSKELGLLHAAAYLNAYDCFCYLTLDKECNIFAKDKESLTPIHYALKGSSEEVIAFIFWLIDNNKEYQTQFNNLLESDYPLSRATPKSLLYYAIEETNSTFGLEELFAHGYSLGRVSRNEKYKLQDHCTNLANLHGLELLLQNDAINGTQSDNRQPPIINAIIVGNTKAVDILVKCGANLQKKCDGKSPLQFACEAPIKNKEIVQIILDNTEVLDSAEFKTAGPSIIHACRSYNVDIAELVIQRGVDCNLRDRVNHTAAYYLAAWKNQEDAANILKLMMKHNFNLNPECQERDHPITEILSLFKINPQLIEIFLQNEVPIPAAALNKLRKRAQRDKELKFVLDKYGFGQ